MTIAEVILQEYPRLNAEQKAIIGHSDGPLLVIAGPGSGKTFTGCGNRHSYAVRLTNRKQSRNRNEAAD